LLRINGIKHGWFMRYGGVSEDLFESLNGKKGMGDPDKNVDENRRRAINALFPGSKPENNLVHIIHQFKTGILTASEPGEFKDYDACMTIDRELVLSQTTADCASLVIADLNRKVIALVHGSWHTLKANLICDVVAKLKQLSGVGELVAGIGPMICKNCYEFGPEARDLFDTKYLITPQSHPEFISGSEESDSKILKQVQNDKQTRYLVDLKQMVIDQLKDSGISKIDDVHICTKEDERFFSHRRSGADSGRMITLASLK
jgi:YfiH family protein